MEKYKRTLIYRCVAAIAAAALIIALSYYFEANPIKLSFDQFCSTSNGLLVAFVIYYAFIYCVKTFVLIHNGNHSRSITKRNMKSGRC